MKITHAVNFSYHGKRCTAGLAVVVRHDDGCEEPLDPRLDLRMHSPTGFECGYEGSGPAQLALAILAHVSGDDGLARRHYQRFKREIIAGLKGPGDDEAQDYEFVLPGPFVQGWLLGSEGRERHGAGTEE